MAFPVVATRATGRTTNTNTTTHAITLPSGVVAGNLLVVVFSVDGNPTVTAQQAGWNKLNQASNGTLVTGAIFWKVATGSDALTLTTTVAEASSHASFRITNGGTPTATSAVATSTNTNPPPHTPPSGSRDYLWIATRSGDSTTVATAAPASYANLQTQAAQGTNGASTNTAERSLAAASEDPGTFTSASIAWQAWTIAVPPSNATAVPVLVASTATVGEPTVVIPQVRTMAAVASTATVATPSLATHYPALVASTASVATPSPAKSTTVPALVASSATVATPTLTTAVSRTVVTVSSTASVALPVVIGTQVLTAALLVNTAVVATPTVATRYPITIASTASVATPTVATHYPVAIASTSTVLAPTVVVWLRPITIVNRPTLLTTSTGLAPSTSLLPSAGGDRFFPPTTTVNLASTHLPTLVVNTSSVPGPTIVAGGITATAALVVSTPTVQPIAGIDYISQLRRPRLVTSTVVPSTRLAPGMDLVPTAGPETVHPPVVWRGAPLTVDDLEPIPSAAVVHAPAVAAMTVRPRFLSGLVVPGPGVAPSADLVPATGLATVHLPTVLGGAVVVYLDLVPGLYPSENLYPSETLYPLGPAEVHAPTVHPGVIAPAPAPIPPTSAVHAPTLTGSGVNYVPLIFMELAANTAAVFEPTIFIQSAEIEPEFLDTEESVAEPNIVLQGETLLLPGFVASATAVALPTVVAGAVQVHPDPVLSTASVGLPQVVMVQIRVLQVVPSGAAVRRPLVRGGAPPRGPRRSGLSAGAPALSGSAVRAGVPVPV